MGLYTHTHTHTHTCVLENNNKKSSVQKNGKSIKFQNIKYVENLKNVEETKKFEREREKNWYSQKTGITLIALVITIIVLIILAGISITMISGQDGILTRAEVAKKQNDIAGTKEQIKLELIGKYDANGKYTNADVIDAVAKVTGHTVAEKNDKVLSKNGNKVDISDLWVTSGGSENVDRTGIEVGDYINYTPDSVKGYSKSKLAESITGTGGNGADLAQDKLNWQVLRIYDDGSMDLIGSPTSKEVYFSGAIGYNNGVYVMNDICESLYSKKSKGITARSINLEDMEKWLTDDVLNADGTVKTKGGKTARAEYKNSDSGTLYGKTKTYTRGIKPDIYGKTENESDKYYTTPTTNTYTGGSSSDTLEAKQTYYYIPINSTNYGDGAKALTASSYYWVASRSVNCDSIYAVFGLRGAGNYIFGSIMFNSYSHSYTVDNSLRPVVSLGSDIQVEKCSGDNSSSNMHTINWN